MDRYYADMAKKVIIDVDPGIDDAIALAIALFDPRLEVLAVTATGGNVSSEQASNNLQAIIAYLDPPRTPRIGIALENTILPERSEIILIAIKNNMIPPAIPKEDCSI